MRRRILQTGLALLAVMAAAPWMRTVQAVETQPLPAFEVSTPDGRRAVSSRQLSAEAQWLIIYVTTDCPACDRLLDALKGWQLSPRAGRIVVIAGGSAEKIRPYLLQRTQAGPPTAAMYADQFDAARAALAVTASPTLIGVRDGQIVWSLSGVLNDPSALEGVIRKWLE